MLNKCVYYPRDRDWALIFFVNREWALIFFVNREQYPLFMTLIHMSTPGSPGLRGQPNRAPHWPDQVFPNWPPNPTDSTKLAAPAYIRTFTGSHVNIHFTSRTTTIHFLHMAHSNTQLEIYYTDFTYTLAGLY